MSTGQGQSYYKVSTAFERSLGTPVLPGLVTVGRFLLPSSDPVVLSAAKAPPLAPCLAAASTGQKVVLHNNNTNAAAAKKSAKRGEKATGSPKAAVAGGNDEAALRTFSFGKEPTAIGAGQLNRAAAVPLLRQQDALLFGGSTSLLAYDVDQNRQHFYKEVEDGVRAIASGEVRTADGEAAPVLALVGGNCAVYGFDGEGTERYWTVTGDQVTAMAMLPWATGRGTAPALLTASEDYEVRVFDGEEAISSIMEVDCVRQLVPLAASTTSAKDDKSTGHFAYLLKNGTVGVYHHTERLWRIKSRCLPVSAAFCDVDCDGVAELVVGYDNGRVEVRSDLRAGGGSKGGEVLFRDTYAAPVAAVLAEDYRQDGRVLPLVCTVDGTLRGLTLLESRLGEAEETRDTQALEALAQQRALLASQLASLEEQLALQERGEQDITMPEAGLEVVCALQPNFATQLLDVTFTLRNAPSDAVVHSCVVHLSLAATAGVDGASSEDNTRCFFADTATATLVCPIPYQRDVAAQLTTSVAVGSAFAENYQVHDVSVGVPAFVAYQLPHIVREQYPQLSVAFTPPSGAVTLTFDRRLCMEALEGWLRRSFSVPPGLSLADADRPQAPVLHLEVVSMHGDCASLSILIDNGIAAGATHSTIVVCGETMDACGDVVTSLGELAGGVAEDNAAPVRTECNFSGELQALQGVLARVDELNGVRLKLSTDMADAATVVKTLLIVAEDARLLGDMTSMRKGYAALYDVDQELLGENMKRASNYEELKQSLKEVNRFIQQVGRLRLGAAQRSAVVTACRNALKQNKTAALVDIVRAGSAT